MNLLHILRFCPILATKDTTSALIGQLSSVLILRFQRVSQQPTLISDMGFHFCFSLYTVL